MSQPTACYYFYRLRNDNFIYEFCVAGSVDANQRVDSWAKSGEVQHWKKHNEGDLIVFTSPDGYDGGPVGWCYDRRLQRGEPMPREQLEKESLRNRVSLVF